MSEFHSDEKLIDRLADTLGFTVDHDGVLACKVYDKDGKIVTDGGYPYVIMSLRQISKQRKEQALHFKLINRVNAMNSVHTFLDEAKTNVERLLAKGGYTTNADGQLHKKYRDMIKSMLDNLLEVTDGVKRYNIEMTSAGWLRVEAQALYLEDKNFHLQQSYGNWVNVYDVFSNKAETRDQAILLVDFDHMLQAHNDLPVLEANKSEIDSLIIKHKHLLGVE